MIDPCPNETLLTAYLDGELSQPDARRVCLHLECCLECRQYLAEQKATDDMVLTLPAREPSDDFDRTFWRKVAALEEKQIRRFWSRYLLSGWRPLLTAGIAAGLIVAGLIFMDFDRKLSPEEMFIAENIELLNEYDVVHNLDLLQDWEIMEIMKEHS